MRVQLTGSYAGGAFELRTTPEGTLFRAVESDQIIRVGNSIGGYWAKPITYAGQQMLALVRIGNSKLGLPIAEIRRQFRDQKGAVLWPGDGLWAMSSGAARRGVWHRIREDKDPVRNALRAIGLPSDLLRNVDKIPAQEVEDGWGWRCGEHRHDDDSRMWFLADGQETSLGFREEKLDWKPYQCCCKGRDLTRVEGGTYLIKGWNDRVSQVLVTPAADLGFVARLTHTLGRYNEVVLLEVEKGLRCPECKNRGCSIAVHDARRAETDRLRKHREEEDAGLFVRVDNARYRVIASTWGFEYKTSSGSGWTNGNGWAVETAEGGAYVSQPYKWDRPSLSKLWDSDAGTIYTCTDLKTEQVWTLKPGKGNQWTPVHETDK